ncbi:MAG: NADH-quinone oxidoreductase subunit J [Desulfobulbus propionicus]|nr:MAG: NADH-quinone oxidoreductase subunit J [Desulfobulbus propionicus]
MQPLAFPPSPPFFSAETYVGFIFLITLSLVIGGALIAVTSVRLVRAVSGLAVCFTGLAGVYYFLLSPFVAMMQMLIYVGAVSILIAFGIMMSSPDQHSQPGILAPSRLIGPLAVSMGGLFFAGFSLLALNTNWQVFPRAEQAGSNIQGIGTSLLTRYALIFEAISIVLLMAIIGALVLARRGRS